MQEAAYQGMGLEVTKSIIDLIPICRLIGNKILPDMKEVINSK